MPAGAGRPHHHSAPRSTGCGGRHHAPPRHRCRQKKEVAGEQQVDNYAKFFCCCKSVVGKLYLKLIYGL